MRPDFRELLSRPNAGRLCVVVQDFNKFEHLIKKPLRAVLFDLTARKQLPLSYQEITPRLLEWLVLELHERIYLMECSDHFYNDYNYQRIYHALMNRTNGDLERWFGRCFFRPIEFGCVFKINLALDRRGLVLKFRKGYQR